MSDERFLSYKDLVERKQWPFSRDHTRRLVREGKFPKPFKTSGEFGRNVWRESDVDAWLEQKKTG